jgi:hypothetical protein
MITHIGRPEAKTNRYLKTSGSSWTLAIKYRDPRAGHHYGSAGALKQAHAKSISLYLRQRMVTGG